MDEFRKAIELAILAARSVDRQINPYLVESARTNANALSQKADSLLDGEFSSANWHGLFATFIGCYFVRFGEPSYNELESFVDKVVRIYEWKESQSAAE
ncbi:MAG: hypothetical protein RID09_07040 [Coleofasciculus sp. G1-WW12-02]|uniref:hypothetical protein n=1 Tax=Coleofasciculus sp. G1-WW12-02 TaxID=3068483 RepID=UPI0032F34EAF